MTLLEKAMASKRRRTMNSMDGEQRELFLAYLDGEVTLAQAAGALGVQSSQIHTRASQLLLTMYRNGELVRKEQPK